MAATPSPVAAVTASARAGYDVLARFTVDEGFPASSYGSDWGYVPPWIASQPEATDMLKIRFSVPILLQCLVGVAAIPTSTPSDPDLDSVDQFRSAHYVSVATDLQSLPPDERHRRLVELANDRRHSMMFFALCSMLFEPEPGQELRRAMLGQPVFVGGGQATSAEDDRRWPLEPITIRDQLPILVVYGYNGGPSEPPLEYLAYCNANGVWRSKAFPKLTFVQRSAILQEFVKTIPKLSEHRRNWLLAQARDGGN